MCLRVVGLLSVCISYNFTLLIGFPFLAFAPPAFSSWQIHLSLSIHVAPGNQGGNAHGRHAQWQGGGKKECFTKKRRKERQSIRRVAEDRTERSIRKDKGWERMKWVFIMWVKNKICAQIMAFISFDYCAVIFTCKLSNEGQQFSIAVVAESDSLPQLVFGWALNFDDVDRPKAPTVSAFNKHKFKSISQAIRENAILWWKQSMGITKIGECKWGVDCDPTVRGVMCLEFQHPQIHSPLDRSPNQTSSVC